MNWQLILLSWYIPLKPGSVVKWWCWVTYVPSSRLCCGLCSKIVLNRVFLICTPQNLPYFQIYLPNLHNIFITPQIFKNIIINPTVSLKESKRNILQFSVIKMWIPKNALTTVYMDHGCPQTNDRILRSATISLKSNAPAANGRFPWFAANICPLLPQANPSASSAGAPLRQRLLRRHAHDNYNSARTHPLHRRPLCWGWSMPSNTNPICTNTHKKREIYEIW